jgi:O-acetyl-ADP-ribose deacetylase (regulator of RNase III)
MLRKVNNSVLELTEGDITEMDTDAIVNAANSYLKHGGGVAGAIVRKGGRIIQDESDKIGYCPVGQAVITGAGSLKAKHVIHTVGPRMGEGKEDDKLKNATLNSLKLADSEGLESITFPPLSSVALWASYSFMYFRIVLRLIPVSLSIARCDFPSW